MNVEAVVVYPFAEGFERHLHDPLAERDHKARLLRDGDELLRGNPAERLVVPPEQRLEPAQLSRRYVVLRLVVLPEIALERVLPVCVVELVLYGELFHEPVLHDVLENADPVLPVLLRVEHRHVRVPQKLLEIGAVVGVDRNSRGEFHSALVEKLEDEVPHVERGPVRLDFVHHDDEFVAPEPVGAHVLRLDFLEDFRRLHNQLVARRMPARVVYYLHVVEVGEHYPEFLPER